MNYGFGLTTVLLNRRFASKVAKRFRGVLGCGLDLVVLGVI